MGFMLSYILLAGLVGSGAGGAGAPEVPARGDAPAIVGLVTDESGVPLANVQVVAEGTPRAVLTGADGRFVLSGLRAGSYHINASLIGYAPAHVEVTLPEAGEEVEVEIRLAASPLVLEGILVTGSATASNPLTATQSTVQLSGRELDRALGSSVARTLEAQPGMATRYSGPAAATPVIRGLTGERVLVLENGQRTGDLSGTSADHALTTDPLAASRVEVVRGPASLLYGSSALGGVVNVVRSDIPTEVPTRVQGSVAGQAETAAPGGAGSGVVRAAAGDRVAVVVAGGARAAGDVRAGDGSRLDNTQLTNLHGEAGLGYVGEGGAGGVAVSAYRFGYGLPAAPGAAESGVRVEGRRQQVKGEASLGLGDGPVGQLRASGSAQWYTHDEIEDTGEVGTTFQLRTQTLDVRTTTRIAEVDGAAGASALFRQYDPTGEEALTPPARTSALGAFLYQEVPIRGLGHEGDDHAPLLQVGARYDVYRISTAADARFGRGRTLDFSALSGSIGVNVPLSHEAAIGVSVARGFRAPSVEELFSDAYHPATGSFERGNPALSEETNLGAEAVLRVQGRSVQAQASTYYNRIGGFITPVLGGLVEIFDEDGARGVVPLTDYGQADATLIGAEASAEVVVAPHLVLGLLGDVVRGEMEGGAAIPFMPAARLGGLARYANGPLSLGAELRHAFARREVAENELATGAFDLLDLTASYSVRARGRQHTLTLRAENALDEAYRDPTSRIKAFAPNPGRNLGLVYRLYF